MDAEVFHSHMVRTRASVDQTLDELDRRLGCAEHSLKKGGVIVVLFAGLACMAVWLRRRHAA